MDRRKFLVGAGGAFALVGLGATWRVTRAPQTAHLPWAIDPQPLEDQRLDAFRYAILAPNPHNRQPWLIKLEGADEAILTCDLERRLPETDPFDRQIVIGFGAFIELARIAAAQHGIRIDVTPFPDGEPAQRLDQRPVARLRFLPDATTQRDPLFAQILKRHTNRDPFDMARAAPEAIARHIAEGDGWTVDAGRVAAIRTITVEAITTEFNTPRANQESVDLMRIGHSEIDANPDGIALSGPMIEALDMTGQISRAQLADPKSSVFEIGLKGMRDVYASYPALIWIKTPTNTRADQLEAGRRYVRACLRTASRGLNIHPMSQSLQEYAEVSAAFASVHKLLGASGNERIQMLARIGYGTQKGPAPRWPMESHIIT